MGKGYFFLLTTLPGRGWNMAAIKKCTFFLGPKNPDFGPKIRFFVWDRVFWQSGARNPRRWFRFGTFGSIVRFFVSELRPFSWGEPGRRAKKSYPTPLWGHRLPVTALALSARRPFRPARFARGLDNLYIHSIFIVKTKKSILVLSELNSLTRRKDDVTFPFHVWLLLSDCL